MYQKNQKFFSSRISYFTGIFLKNKAGGASDQLPMKRKKRLKRVSGNSFLFFEKCIPRTVWPVRKSSKTESRTSTQNPKSDSDSGATTLLTRLADITQVIFGTPEKKQTVPNGHKKDWIVRERTTETYPRPPKIQINVRLTRKTNSIQQTTPADSIGPLTVVDSTFSVFSFTQKKTFPLCFTALQFFRIFLSFRLFLE